MVLASRCIAWTGHESRWLSRGEQALSTVVTSLHFAATAAGVRVVSQRANRLAMIARSSRRVDDKVVSDIIARWAGDPIAPEVPRRLREGDAMPGALKTQSGRRLTGPDIDRLTKRIEDGLDLSTWKPRPGRPSLSAAVGAHSPRIAVRIPEDLHRRAVERATLEGRSISEVVRSLLEDYAPHVPSSRNGRNTAGQSGGDT